MSRPRSGPSASGSPLRGELAAKRTEGNNTGATLESNPVFSLVRLCPPPSSRETRQSKTSEQRRTRGSRHADSFVSDHILHYTGYITACDRSQNGKRLVRDGTVRREKRPHGTSPPSHGMPNPAPRAASPRAFRPNRTPNGRAWAGHAHLQMERIINDR